MPTPKLQPPINTAFIQDAAWVSDQLTQLQTTRFHGKLTICLEGGVVIRCIEEKSTKPPHRAGGNGS